MSKFTKGPWRYITSTGICSGKGRDTVVISWMVYDSLSIETVLANAALIAASPDLYAIMLEVYEASKLRRPIKKKTFEAVCEVLRKVDGIWR